MFNLGEEEKSAATVWDSTHNKSIKSPYEKLKASPRTQPHIYDETADGSKQIADALVLARKGQKSVLIDFGANWCIGCHTLHQLFETNKDVATELESDYVVVMLDVNKRHNKDIDTSYGHPTRFGLPALVVLDASGKQLITEDSGNWEEGGHHNPAKVLAFLKEWAPKKLP